jgi:hypothetical protein
MTCPMCTERGRRLIQSPTALAETWRRLSAAEANNKSETRMTSLEDENREALARRSP